MHIGTTEVFLAATIIALVISNVTWLLWNRLARLESHDANKELAEDYRKHIQQLREQVKKLEELSEKLNQIQKIIES